MTWSLIVIFSPIDGYIKIHLLNLILSSLIGDHKGNIQNIWKEVIGTFFQLQFQRICNTVLPVTAFCADPFASTLLPLFCTQQPELLFSKASFRLSLPCLILSDFPVKLEKAKQKKNPTKNMSLLTWPLRPYVI